MRAFLFFLVPAGLETAAKPGACVSLGRGGLRAVPGCGRIKAIGRGARAGKYLKAEKKNGGFNMIFGRKRDGARTAGKNPHALDMENDIRYRGPLSYRSFRIMGWACIALSQIAVMLTLAGRLDPTLADTMNAESAAMKLISSMALPFLLLANFAVILNAGEDYKRQLARFGGIAAAVAAGSVFFYRRYIVGGVAALLGSRAEAKATLAEVVHASLSSGYFCYNLFIDLFLCTLLFFFLNYCPKRLFTGERLKIFRAFAVFPVAYEVVSILLKTLAVEGKVTLPFIVFPFLTVKPPMTFLAFIMMAVYIKKREWIFLKNGKTREDYQRFLKTNRNSIQFSKFTAKILALTAVLDIIAVIAVIVSLYLQNPDGEIDKKFFLPHLDALGLGESITLLLIAPLMLLFSYTRIPKNPGMDILIPIFGVAVIALIYFEGFYQLFLMAQNNLGSSGLGALDGLLLADGLGELEGFEGTAGAMLGP